MKPLREGVDLDDFLELLRDAPARILLLDYDGTLAPFREERDQAVPYPGVREEVAGHLAAGDSRIVVVSGRAVEDVRPLLGVEPPPEIWGNHGWERLVPGQGLERSDPGARAREGLKRGGEVVERAVPAERVEVKPVSLAIHTRGLEAAEAADLERDVSGAWSDIAAEYGLDVHAFDGGLELRVPGRDKGTAIRQILEDEPGEAVVAYLGDDRTDEDAFLALGERGDRALRVLVRVELRETEADLWLQPPDEMLSFLERWREAAAG